MSQTLTISDKLYVRLTQAAREYGFNNIEQLLDMWQTFDTQRQHRQHIIEQIDHVRERMFVTYGELPDSVDLLREDRAR